MRLSIAVRQRLPAIAVIAVLAVSVVAPILQTRIGSAAQLTERRITLSSSKVGQTDTGYTAVFKLQQAGALEGIVIDFCSNSPLVGASCTAPTGFDSNKANYAFSVTGHTSSATPGVFAKSASVNADINTVILTRTDTANNTSGTEVTVTFGSTGANDGFTNPTTLGTYYARILIYATAAGANGYTSATPGTYTNDGGVALSTANQLSVSARVQEQLEFCVASINADVDGLSNGDGVTPDPAELPTSCSHTVFTGASNDKTVDLGVVDSTAPSVTPVVAAVGGDNQNGGILIRTNAAYGVTITYYAELDTASGSLKVPGATCGSTVFGTGSTTDQCFNSAGTTQLTFDTGAAGEKFGMTAGKVVRPTGSTTTNLVRSTDYDGNGKVTATACAPATVNSDSCFAWVDTGSSSTTTLASSTTVLDYEMLILNFAARSAATTPTGAYQVVSTYIATSKF